MEKRIFKINGELYPLERVVECNQGYDYTDDELLKWLNITELRGELYMDSVGIKIIRIK